MRFKRTDEGDWIVSTEPGEHGFTAVESLGVITARGHIVKARGWPRGFGDRVMRALEQARHQLYQRGQLRNYDFEREVREEQRTGTFIVELEDGRERRFHSMRSANAANVGTALERPGALDWAVAEVESGRVRRADIFRADARPRPAIYVPTILPPRDEHPALVIGDVKHLPIHFLDTNRGRGQQVPWARGVVHDLPEAARRAYALKRIAMTLVDDRALGRGRADPTDIADAWDVATDAFIEAALPLQEAFARRNAAYWRARGGVSSRRPARPRGRRR